MPDPGSYAEEKLRAAFTVKGLSAETMAAVQAGELEIVADEDDPQAEMLRQQGGQE